MSYFIGVDLGQASEVTALVVVESETLPHIRTDEIWEEYRGDPEYGRSSRSVTYQPVFRKPDGSETTKHPPVAYALRHIERLKEGTSYPQIIERVNAVKGTIGNATLILDVTGVGRAAVELFRKAGLYFQAITITGGDALVEDGSDFRVPKRDLVSAAQVMLQTGKLKIAKGLPHAKLLLRELQRFRVRFEPTHGNDYLAWREGPQDDLVLALSAALWVAEKNPGIPSSMVVGGISMFAGFMGF